MGYRVVVGLRCLTEYFSIPGIIVQIKLLISYDNVEGYFNSKRKLEIILARMGCGNIMLIYSVFSKDSMWFWGYIMCKGVVLI